MRYMIIIERGPQGYCAYVPGLPGYIAVADTEAEVRRLIQEAIAFHLEGLKEEGQAIPAPRSYGEFVDIPA